MILAEGLGSKHTCIRVWKDDNKYYITWAYLVNFPVIILMTGKLSNIPVVLREES